MTTITADSIHSSGNDAHLVALSRSGNRDAFGRIVARYQSLICSIGYSATGSLSQSEDLAQETFLNAWKQLRDLHEPAKLRAWLCGIARNLINNLQRRSGFEPSADAETDAAIAELPAVEPLPGDRAISEQEQTILWRSLENIPPLYREPLILFYRQQHSIEQVGAALDLGEDVVKQRLSRGRKLLHEQVLAFVEGALERSAPRAAFTLAVVAALPSVGTSASAAVIGTTAAKGGALAKSAALVALFNVLLGPIIGIASGILGVRTSLHATRTPLERKQVLRSSMKIFAGIAIFTPLLILFVQLGAFWEQHPHWFVALGMLLPSMFSIWLLASIVSFTRQMQRLRESERLAHPELFAATTPGARREFSEYRSRAGLFGLPLVHIQFGTPPKNHGPAIGWIAIGERAIGVVFAMGAIAAGGISVGAVSVGVISLGCVSVAVVSMGTVAFGLFGFGAIAIGNYAMGAFAAAWTAAVGALAVAHDFAWGEVAFATHANDLVAGQFMLLHHATAIFNTALIAIGVLAIVPAIGYFSASRRHIRQSPNSRSQD